MTNALPYEHRRWLARLIISACLLLVCIAFTRKVQAAFLNHQVTNMTAEMQDLKMKPTCVGRFVIDLPADAEVSYRGAMVAGWSIVTYEETDEHFTARLEERENQLSGQKNERGMPSLESTRKFDGRGLHGKVLVFDRQWIPGLPHEPITEAVKAEAMIRVQKHSFNLSMKYVNDNDLQELTKLVTHQIARGKRDPSRGWLLFRRRIYHRAIKSRAERTHNPVRRSQWAPRCVDSAQHDSRYHHTKNLASTRCGRTNYQRKSFPFPYLAARGAGAQWRTR